MPMEAVCRRHGGQLCGLLQGGVEVPRADVPERASGMRIGWCEPQNGLLRADMVE